MSHHFEIDPHNGPFDVGAFVQWMSQPSLIGHVSARGDDRVIVEWNDGSTGRYTLVDAENNIQRISFVSRPDNPLAAFRAWLNEELRQCNALIDIWGPNAAASQNAHLFQYVRDEFDRRFPQQETK